MARASSSEISGRMSRRRSSSPWCAKRNPPAVKNELPPRWDSGAFSTTSTDAPAPRAASAAHSAALPPPTTTTSCTAMPDLLYRVVANCNGCGKLAGVVANRRVALASDHAGEHGEAEGDAIPAERREVVGLYPPDEPAHHEKRRGRRDHGAEGEQAPVRGHRARVSQRVLGLVQAGREQGGDTHEE